MPLHGSKMERNISLSPEDKPPALCLWPCRIIDHQLLESHCSYSFCLSDWKWGPLDASPLDLAIFVGAVREPPEHNQKEFLCFQQLHDFPFTVGHTTKECGAGNVWQRRGRGRTQQAGREQTLQDCLYLILHSAAGPSGMPLKKRWGVEQKAKGETTLGKGQEDRHRQGMVSPGQEAGRSSG